MSHRLFIYLAILSLVGLGLIFSLFRLSGFKAPQSEKQPASTPYLIEDSALQGNMTTLPVPSLPPESTLLPTP